MPSFLHDSVFMALLSVIVFVLLENAFHFKNCQWYICSATFSCIAVFFTTGHQVLVVGVLNQHIY